MKLTLFIPLLPQAIFAAAPIYRDGPLTGSPLAGKFISHCLY